ncbi:CLC_0170 family protein [Paenibacillus sp. 2RAB27]|uniref:CLC_0170 family protein n=1 Tax=Paenibacillus sp. 2RAB27 TaxID=3232991 RepID=UPI003F9A4B9B
MITFNNYTVLLLLVSGLLVLVFDVKNYTKANMLKEKKAALFAGWFNISLGVLSFFGYLVYERWFWK